MKDNLKCKRYPGQIISRYSETGKVYYLDQLDDFDEVDYPSDPKDLPITANWIIYTYFPTYLRKWYGISVQEYYQIVVFGDINHVPTCPYCNTRKLRWSNENRLSGEYTTTCLHEECLSKVYSESAKLNLVYYTHEELSERQRINGSKKWEGTTEEDRREMMRPVYEAGDTVEARALGAYNLVLSQGDKDDDMYFYIATGANDEFKFGITSNINNRLDWSHPYKNWKLLFSDKRFRLAELEYWIKIDLNIRSEYISWSMVSEFRKSYLTRYREIIILRQKDW